MEPGVIAIATIMAVGGVIAMLAIVTHVFEWRLTKMLVKKKQEKADLEKAAQSPSECKSPMRITASPALAKIMNAVPFEKENAQSPGSPGYATLKSPTSPIATLSPASASFGEILIITTPELPVAPELVHSPLSTCSTPSPVTPYTPLTPYIASSTVAATPLLSGGLSFSNCEQGEPARDTMNDPYTHLAPRVMGSRLRRYASPPRHLRVTIPDSNTKPFERSHRKLPSETVITAPPRVLARSISELVGDDSHDDAVFVASCSPTDSKAMREVRATEQNVKEVASFGW